MQLILLLLLAFGVSAQETCDPVVAAKECFSQLCKIPPNHILLQEPEEVLKTLKKKGTNKLSPELTKNIQLQVEGIRRIKSFAKKALDKNEVPQLVDDLIESTMKRKSMMDGFYSGVLKCAASSFPCELIRSDMEKTPESVAEAYRLINDLHTFEENFYKGSIRHRRSYILPGLKILQPFRKNISLEDENKKIAEINTESELLNYLKKSELYNFRTIILSKLEEHKNELIRSITDRARQMIDEKVTEERLIDSCLLAEQFEKEIKSKGSEAQFKKAVTAHLAEVSDSFLSKLSSSSAKVIKKGLRADSYNLIELRSEALQPELTGQAYELENHMGEIQTLGALKSLPRLADVKNFGCKISGFHPKDYYQKEEIHISQVTLADESLNVVAHETGHWLSHAVAKGSLSKHSSEKLLRVRNCVQNFNPTNPKTFDANISHPGDGQTTDEDFADWFSAQFSHRGGFFCYLEKLIKPSLNDLYQPGHGQLHSNTLFRELNLRIQKSESIPKSCQDLMDSYPEITIKKCEF